MLLQVLRSVRWVTTPPSRLTGHVPIRLHGSPGDLWWVSGLGVLNWKQKHTSRLTLID